VPAKWPFPHPRKAYELWFEYLRLARSSALPAVTAALKRSEKRYESWGDVGNVRFDAWFAEHDWLFEDTEIVQTIFSRSEIPEDINGPIFDDHIYLAIRLCRAPSELAALVQDKLRVAMMFDKGKSKRQAESRFFLTEGSEPKLDALQISLRIYRDVVLRGPRLKGAPRLLAIQTYYGDELPSQLRSEHGTTNAMRNVNRYIAEAKKTMLNVANGSFPGSKTKV
jgi:hypothetical protein